LHIPIPHGKRGLNEYTSKLVRQYIPKKALKDAFSDDEILKFQYKINRRPRKLLTLDSPWNVSPSVLNNPVAFAT
jgi:IS30 family transposase